MKKNDPKQTKKNKVLRFILRPCLHFHASTKVGKKCTYYFVNCVVVEVHKPRRVTRVPKFSYFAKNPLLQQHTPSFPKVERRVKRQNSVKCKNESAFHTRGKPRGLKTNHVRRESRGFGTKSTFYGLEGADLTKESASQYLVGKIPDLWKNVTTSFQCLGLNNC